MPESSPETKTDASAQAPVAATSIMDEYPFKVFVGNLAFKTTDENLKEAFQPAGKVEVANVIRRGHRSLGYGFVALDSADAVAKAVAELDKLTLDGRLINVEAAKPKDDLTAERQDRTERPKRGRGGRRPASRRRLEDEGEEGTAAASEQTAGAEQGDKAANDQDGSGRSQPRARRGSAVRRRHRGPPSGEPSATTIFVSNLPYSMDDSGLRDIFKDYKVVSATVVTRFGGARSKGFGFVEFASEEDQKRALAKAEDFESEGRRLLVKVAMSGQRPPEKEEARVDDKPAPDAAAKSA